MYVNYVFHTMSQYKMTSSLKNINLFVFMMEKCYVFSHQGTNWSFDVIWMNISLQLQPLFTGIQVRTPICTSMIDGGRSATGTGFIPSASDFPWPVSLHQYSESEYYRYQQ